MVKINYHILFYSISNTEIQLKSSSTHLEILEAMRNPITGVGFLTQHQSLPSHTFVSADAVTWLMNHLEDINDLEQAMQV